MLSIIIPTLNEEKFLPKTLELLQKQIPQGCEIIVSDGNSDDKTLSVAKKYGCKTVVSKKRSPAIQRNAGARIAKGDILLFLDADTELPNMFFPNAVDEFERRSLDVASFYFRFHSDKFIYKLATLHGNIMMFLIQLIHPVGVGAALLVRKHIHDEVGGFDERIVMGEDHEYCTEIGKHHRFGVIRSAIILFSVRRFELEGVWQVVWKWYYYLIYYLFHGPVYSVTIPYEFGKYN